MYYFDDFVGDSFLMLNFSFKIVAVIVQREKNIHFDFNLTWSITLDCLYFYLLIDFVRYLGMNFITYNYSVLEIMVVKFVMKFYFVAIISSKSNYFIKQPKMMHYLIYFMIEKIMVFKLMSFTTDFNINLNKKKK